MVVTYKAADIIYEYHINKAAGLLTKSVGTYKNGTSVTCTYANFRQVGTAQFPAAIELTLGGINRGDTGNQIARNTVKVYGRKRFLSLEKHVSP